MPQDRYFDKFPQITYSNTFCVDITRRIKFTDIAYFSPYIFYTYDISENERPDQFSYRYYDDQYKTWILYLSNKIVDPYYEWYLSDDEFNSFLTTKYGSVVESQQKIDYYRNDWTNSDPLETNGYEALAFSLKKYWHPVYDDFGNILEYKRVPKDWKITTNKIVSYEVSNTNFTENEICDIVFTASNTGSGQVISSSNTRVYLKHLSGTHLESNTITISGSSYIYGRESEVNTIFTSATLESNNIAPEEEVYWRGVTHYDEELEKNEFNKTIKVLDSNFSTNVVVNLVSLMEEI
jgi:hypothetical protein